MSYWQIFVTFLRFGLLAWGGPVAQIAMVRDELVEKQKWISGGKFNRALAVYQALPGPEAHEICVYMGMVKAGRLGGFLAGLGFMMPGFMLMLILAYFYTMFGASLLALFIGVIPAVTALITKAAHKLAQNILITKPLLIVAADSALLTAFDVHFILVFAICALWQALWAKGKKNAAVIFIILSSVLALAYGIINSPHLMAEVSQSKDASLAILFVEGLKGGLLSFGGAYTAIPFLQDSMVGNYNGIDNATFLNAIGLSGVIPAPLIIFVTFLGFAASGLWGAIVITFGIFLPAFMFTLLFHNKLERLIEHKPANAALDGVSAGVVGILIVTAIKIIAINISSLTSVIIFAAALLSFYLLKSRLAIPAVIIASAITGYFIQGVL